MYSRRKSRFGISENTFAMFVCPKFRLNLIWFNSMIQKESSFCWLFVLLMLFSTGISGQQSHPDWYHDRPQEYSITTYDSSTKIKSRVKMWYYIVTDEYKYYWQKNKPNKKFGEDFKVDEGDDFIVKIEFRPIGKEPKQNDLQLIIPSKLWATATGCLIGPKDFDKEDFVIYHGGHKELVFGLIPDCKSESKVNIDFELKKNGKLLAKRKNGSESYKKTTSVIIAIETAESGSQDAIITNDAIAPVLPSRAEVPAEQGGATIPENNVKPENALEPEGPIEQEEAIGQSPIKSVEAAIKEIEKSYPDLYEQIIRLQILNDETSDTSGKNLTERKIRDKIDVFCEEKILKANPCDQIVQNLGNLEGYEVYLSTENLKAYQKHKESCEEQKIAKADNEAFANAKNLNTLAAYQSYKRSFPKGMHIRRANAKIAYFIQELDKGDWEAAIKKAAQTDDPCEKLEAYEDYLNKLRSGRNKATEAGRLKEEASNNCSTFRLESRNMDKEAGFYEFEIKNGNPPFTYSINGGKEQVVDGRSIPLNILQGDDYEFAVRDEDGKEFFHTFKAVNPEFAVIVHNGEILIKGGEGPFSFSLKENEAIIYDLKEGQRSLKISDLNAGFGQTMSYSFILLDNNGNELGPERIFLGKDSSLWWVIILLLLVLLAVITYLVRDFIRPYVFKVLPFLDEEGKQWQRAMKAKTLGTFEAYEKKYPEGKYSEMAHSIKLEIQKAEQSLANRDFEEYLQMYGDKALFKEEIDIWKRYQDSATFESCLEELPAGIFREAAENILAESKQIEAPRTGGLKPAAIDFFAEGELDDKEAKEVVLPLSLPPHQYFQFDLSRHWSDSTVQKIWMSKEACLEAYFLIEDAIKNAFRQKETIPEVGGFLVGIPYQVNDKTYEVKIEKFVSVTPENNGEYEVTFGQRAFMELDDVLQENKDKGLTTVGWMHTHPGHGLFLSGKDVEVVNSFFKEPFHVSMEVETKTRDLDTAFFTWRKDLKLNTNKTRDNVEEWFHWEDVKFWLKTDAESS